MINNKALNPVSRLKLTICYLALVLFSVIFLYFSPDTHTPPPGNCTLPQEDLGSCCSLCQKHSHPPPSLTWLAPSPAGLPLTTSSSVSPPQHSPTLTGETKPSYCVLPNNIHFPLALTTPETFHLLEYLECLSFPQVYRIHGKRDHVYFEHQSVFGIHYMGYNTCVCIHTHIYIRTHIYVYIVYSTCPLDIGWIKTCKWIQALVVFVQFSLCGGTGREE